MLLAVANEAEGGFDIGLVIGLVVLVIVILGPELGRWWYNHRQDDNLRSIDDARKER